MMNFSKNAMVIPQVSGANVYFPETLGLGLGSLKIQNLTLTPETVKIFNSTLPDVASMIYFKVFI